MGEPLFTSDLHFYHTKVCDFNSRPWKNEENTERLIELWNTQVRPGDTVYHSGDFSFLGHKDTERLVNLIEALNGTKIMVLGNHDDGRLWVSLRERRLNRVAWIGDLKKVRIHGQEIVLCHYPFEVWNRSHYGSWHLHGHCHGSLPAVGKRLDIGLDNHPQHRFFTFEEIKTHMDAQEIWCPDHHTLKVPRNELVEAD